MIAILIFSLGVLSIIQLQAVSIKQSSDAEYRSTAALLTDDLISRMWTSDRTATALKDRFDSSTNRDGYTQWLDTVKRSGLPNVLRTAPTVEFDTKDADGTKVTVTLQWQAPGKQEELHKYQAVVKLK